MAAVGAAVYLGIADKTEPPDKLEGYGYFVSSFLAYKRNEIERYVTDWEFREYAYHL
jgi:glutamine synthetase